MAYRGNTSNIPCKYFQQGNCKWGNSCKYAHVYANSDGSKQSQANNMSEEELYRSFISPNSMARIQRNILNDLDESKLFQKKPLASAYSYGLPCAVNLINDRDLSPEELRLQYYEARQKGTLAQCEAGVLAREKDMEKCYQHIRSHPDWAARYLQKGTKELRETGQTTLKDGFIKFPVDLTGQAGFGAPASSSFGVNPFTQGQSAFGTTNAFGSGAATAFGQGQAQGSGGAFGFGAGSANTSNAFGGGSTNTSNAFGGGSATNQQPGGVFGKPAFSAPAPGSLPSNSTSAFGAGLTSTQPAATGSVFGQPQFGAGPAASTGTSAFGKPSFGSSSFGQNGFGSSSLNSNQSGGFGAGISTNSPFSSLQNSSNGTQSPFASLQSKPAGASTASPFGSLQNSQASTSSPFGGLQNGSSPATTTTASTGPFGQIGGNNSSPFANLDAASAAKGQGTAQPGFAKPSVAFGATTSGMGNATSPFGQANGGSANVFGSTFNSNPALAAPSDGAGAHRFVQGVPTENSQLSAEDLDKETLQQFEAPSFSLGKVPDIPPPMALVS